MTPRAALPPSGERSLTGRPRVVIDTNAVLDWLLFAAPEAQALGRDVEGGRLVWIGTASMRDELARVLAGRFAARPGRDPASVLAAWQRHCELVPCCGAAPWRCDDPDDQAFVDLAVGAGARWLVSRDKALLRLARRARALDLRIVTPEHWARP